jgi:glucose dehydrogenase
MSEDFDVVIVGAGVAGALCAYKLSQLCPAQKILLLEASEHAIDLPQRQEFREWMVDSPNRGDMHAPYAGLASRRYAPSPEDASKPFPEQKYYDQSGPDAFLAQYVRLVGGTTWAWRGNTPRCVPNDFRLRSEYGVGEDWPITYDDLEPYYCEAERELGVSGDTAAWDNLLGAYRSEPFPMNAIPLSYSDRILQAKLDGFETEIEGEKKVLHVRATPQARNSKDYDGRPSCKGNSNCIPLCPIQAKYDATVHLKKAIAHGVKLRMGCVVTQLETDATGRITTVNYKNWRSANKQEEHKISASIVVLAANAVETAKLLLISNLANRSDQVGRNLTDHLQSELTAIYPEPLYPFRGPQSLSSIEDLRDGDFRRHHSAIRITIGNDGWARAKSPSDVLDDFMKEGKFGVALRQQLASYIPTMMRLGFSTEVLPNPNNRVTLSNKLDDYGLPRPKIRFEVDQYVYNALKKAHEIIVDMLSQINGIKITEREWKREYRTAAHLMGTCRMGHDPRKSVVNVDGRAHDHSNLYIVGASVFVTAATANPTLTVAALALRTADTIANEILLENVSACQGIA